MASFEYRGEVIPLEILISKKRKRWAISVRENGDVVIHLPYGLIEADGVKIAEEHAAWIEKQRVKFLSRTADIRRYEDGDKIPFFGDELIIVRKSGSASAKINGKFLEISMPNEFSESESICTARELVILLYRREGLKVLNQFVEKYADIEGVEKPALRIKIQQSKWGCCTPKNGIIINVRVLLAPKIAAEYLVVHEVVHIRFRNHQKDFWDEVARVMPRYKDAEKLLKEEGWRWIF